MVYFTGWKKMNIHAKLLKVKLLWLFLFFTFMPMLLIALYSYHNIKQQIISSQLSHLQAIAKLKSLQIDSYYKEITNDMHLIQNSPYTKYFLTFDSIGDIHFEQLFREQLNEYVYDNEINNIYIFDPKGNLIASTDKNVHFFPNSYCINAFEKGKKSLNFSDIYRSKMAGIPMKSTYIFYASSPILDSNRQLLGVIVAEFSADTFFNEIQDYTGLGLTGETLLGKRLGNEIVFLNPLRHDPNAGMKRKVKINGTIARPVIMGTMGNIGDGVSIDYRGEKILAAWRYIPSTDWGLVAKIDYKEALKPLEAIRNSIIITSFVLLLFGLVASLKIANSITQPVDMLENEARADSLTGLPNRKLLMEILSQALDKAKENHTVIAVLFLDLDGFKIINDRYGHDIGDLLLKSVALRLTNSIRQSDRVARLGGDEFVILLSGVQNNLTITKIANHIIRSLNETYAINNLSLTIGASIGISIYPDDNAENADEMLRQADKAMYTAKNSGKNHYRLFEQI